MKIGYTCGVFDLFHVGHLNLLENCRKQCDFLIVGVCSDDYVKKCKKTNPIIGEKDRTRIIAALKCVDMAEIVSIEETFDKVLVWQKYKFDILFSGSDWKGSQRFLDTQKSFKEANIDLEIVFFDYTGGISTSNLKEKLLTQ